MEWNKFWILWKQKLLRNVSSLKFQLLIMILLLVVVGMWTGRISDIVGCGLLGVNFVTLAGTRIYAKTKLKEDEDEEYFTRERDWYRSKHRDNDRDRHRDNDRDRHNRDDKKDRYDRNRKDRHDRDIEGIINED